MGAVTPTIAGLFERAFRGAPSERPLAVEWKISLQQMEVNIAPCAANPVHRYVKGVQCPWCTIEVHQNIVYFAAPALVGPGGVVDESIWAAFPQAGVDRLWGEIAKVAPPNVAYEATKRQGAPDPAPIDDDIRAKGRRFIILLCSLAAVAVVLAGLPKVRPYEWLDVVVVLLVWLLRPHGGVDFASRKEALKDAKSSFEHAEEEWRRVCTASEFTTIRARLAQIKTTLSGQRAVYDAELDHVRLTGELQAKKQYMDSQLIRNAKIKGIGPALSSRLQIWNIESALDVTQSVYQVQGIGPAKAAALFEWRSAVERRFRFDPKMINALLNDVKMRHARQRAQGRNELRAGPQMLRQTAVATEAKAYAARAKAIHTRAVLDQAKADMRPMSPLMYR
jgi:DNA-binding helix-hairpin-helix protein with protein kinase domain